MASSIGIHPGLGGGIGFGFGQCRLVIANLQLKFGNHFEGCLFGLSLDFGTVWQNQEPGPYQPVDTQQKTLWLSYFLLVHQKNISILSKKIDPDHWLTASHTVGGSNRLKAFAGEDLTNIGLVS
jgi:hypothetical protein